MKVFLELDGEQNAPPGWTFVGTVDETIQLLESGLVEAFSFGHSPGTDKAASEVLGRLEKILFDEQLDFRVPEVFAVGRDRMPPVIQSVIQSIARLKVENDERLNFIRVEGGCLCPMCGEEYRRHPHDRVWEFLRVLCDGRRVKL